MTRREILRSTGMVAGMAVGLPLAAQTEDSGRKLKVIVVGGHPDDPESGCGGTMARYAALGHEVTALYLTQGEAGIPGTGHEDAARIRTAEAREACKILGARPVFAGQIDGATEITEERQRQFRELLATEEPDIVFVHWPVDAHQDHRFASMLTYGALFAAKKKFALYFYEVMTGSQTQNFAPTDYVDITTTEAKKRAATFAHQSQKPAAFYPHHDAMNRFRGMECRVRFAEGFIRHVSSPASALSTFDAGQVQGPAAR